MGSARRCPSPTIEFHHRQCFRTRRHMGPAGRTRLASLGTDGLRGMAWRGCLRRPVSDGPRHTLGRRHCRPIDPSAGFADQPGLAHGACGSAHRSQRSRPAHPGLILVLALIGGHCHGLQPAVPHGASPRSRWAREPDQRYCDQLHRIQHRPFHWTRHRRSRDREGQPHPGLRDQFCDVRSLLVDARSDPPRRSSTTPLPPDAG